MWKIHKEPFYTNSNQESIAMKILQIPRWSTENDFRIEICKYGIFYISVLWAFNRRVIISGVEDQSMDLETCIYLSDQRLIELGKLFL
jgi:hypothetical protein